MMSAGFRRGSDDPKAARLHRPIHIQLSSSELGSSRLDLLDDSGTTPGPLLLRRHAGRADVPLAAFRAVPIIEAQRTLMNLRAILRAKAVDGVGTRTVLEAIAQWRSRLLGATPAGQPNLLRWSLMLLPQSLLRRRRRGQNRGRSVGT